MLILLCGTVAGAAPLLIVGGDNPSPAEKTAAADLAKDIERVCGEKPVPLAYKAYKSYKDKKYDRVIFIGTRDSHGGIRALAEKGVVRVSAKDPGPEAFVLVSLKDKPAKGKTTLVIAGSDARGTLYGSYEFSRRFLGVDPYEYWTGKTPAPQKGFKIPVVSYREKPPVFPLRGYFDNDDDMIANWKGKLLIIEFDTWKEMIDSLARLRYNYIDLHDTLGRAEFWNWEYYKKMTDYHTDVDLVNKIIDYAHSKGMLVQVPMYTGWEFHHLPYDKICLSRYHDDWMQVYHDYMTDSPLGKADLFLQRPRDPWWDKAYLCKDEMAEGVRPGPLMTKMFDGLLSEVNKNKPGGKVICDLWSEGRIMWNAGDFKPDLAIDMLWADNGYAEYSEWPEDFKGHKFGIYVHAGYFLNHVMQDPYPDRIKTVTMEAVRRGMTHNYFVNGQDFKHFILNMEACARAAWDPEGYDPEKFYSEWLTRYFGAKAAPKIEESLKALHSASAGAGGFTRLLDWTDEIVNKLLVMTAEHRDSAVIEKAVADAKLSLKYAEESAPLVAPGSELLYDDQILFPARIYLINIELYQAAAETANALLDSKDKSLTLEQRKAARERLKEWKKKVPPKLKELRALLDEGSKWKKWEGWTSVKNFRKITPPPDVSITERAMNNLK